MPKLTLAPIGSLQNESTALAQLNANNALIENALENTLSRDGTLPDAMTANLDMNSKRIINLPDAVNAQEPATFGQVADIAAALGNGAIINAQYVTLAAEGALTSERVLTAGPNMSLTDGGPSSTVTVGISSIPLNAIAGTIPAADKLPYFNGASTAALADFTTFGRSLVDDATSTAGRATLGLNNVDNTSDATKNAAVATLTNKTLNFPSLASPTITGGAPNATGMLGYTAPLLNWHDGTTVRNIVGDTSTQTLTNKTYNAAVGGNAFQINSNTISSNTGTSAVNVLQTSPTLITPALGVATATSINGSTVSPGHYSGQPTNGSPAAGEIGEFISASLAQPSHISLTSVTDANIISISLTAGDWNVWGWAGFDGGSTTQVPTAGASISTSSAVFDFTAGRFGIWQAGFATATPFNLGFTGASELMIPLVPVRISISGTTTVYLVAKVQFSVSTAFAFGTICARRGS